MKLLLILATLQALSSATYISELYQNANFDDETVLVPGTATQPVPVPYRYLAFNNFFLGTPPPVTVVALKPSSPPNFAVHPSLPNGASISVTYTGSKVQAFDLRSMNTGCYAPTNNGAASPPINCTITFVGTKAGKNGGTVTKNFVFGVGNALGVGLKPQTAAPVSFPGSFSLLSQVTISVTHAVLPNVAGATVQFAIDNVKYNVYLSKK